ncbi:MAG: TA system VapC family ribonuclease toxin [Verrucomicrobiota bacterium]
MKTYLLDVNVLLALAWPDHTHHQCVHQWWSQHKQITWATCLLTQLGFIRISCHPKFTNNPTTPDIARISLSTMIKRKDHRFWAEPQDGMSNRKLFTIISQAKGHSGITDAYLAALAELHGGRLATLDKALAKIHSEVTELIES